MAGLTPSGFSAKTFDEILESIKGRLRSTFGSGVATNEDEIVMQIVNPIAIEIEEVWQGTELVYDNQNPAAAERIGLDNIGAITGTKRLPGTNSTVVVQASGTEGATIAVGFQRSVQDTLDIFATSELQTLPAVGLQPLEFTMTALDVGVIACLAGNLNQGSLPSGVTSIVNAVDAATGTLAETDEEYRVSRKDRLQALGAGTVVAIKAALRDDVSGVTDAFVTENDTDVTVGALTPHTIRCVVSGGADQDIIDTIGITKAAGTGTIGAISGTFTDPDDGQEFTINYDRITEIDIWVTADVTSKDATYPADGDDQIEAALLALTWDIEEDVVLPKIQNAVTSIPGILTYTVFFDTSSGPSTTTPITISATEQAAFDSSRIVITS